MFFFIRSPFFASCSSNHFISLKDEATCLDEEGHADVYPTDHSACADEGHLLHLPSSTSIFYIAPLSLYITNGLNTLVPQTPWAVTVEEETVPTNEIISSKLDDTNLGMDHVQDQHPNVDAPLQAGLFASYQTNVFSPFRNMVSYYICVIMNLLHDSATC